MVYNYKKNLFWLIAIVALVKLLVAGMIELGNDEVYYWTYALQSDFSHFDHPPMVGLLIRLTSINLLWANSVSLRLGAILCCGISTYFIYLTGKTIFNDKAGWYAALIYNCSVYSGFIAGLFILPDSPQMPFWTLSLFIMSQLLFAEKDKIFGWWFSLGFSIGLACLCKVHGLYLWVGFGLYVLIYRTKLLLNWRIYLAILLTLICLVPILYWNIQNDFITYKFHSERVTHTVLQWDGLLQEVVGEIAYQNPIIYILILISIIFIIRNKSQVPPKVFPFLLFMGLPMILLFWGIALFNATLPHWSGPGFIPFYMMTGYYFSLKFQNPFPFIIKAAAVLIIFVLMVGIGLAQYSPVNFGSKNNENYGEECPTLDISGWDDFGNNFRNLVEKDKIQKKMQPNAPILVSNWFPGGHILFYVANKTENRVIGVGKIKDLHKFAWLNKEIKPLSIGEDAYCIVPSNLPFDVQNNYGSYFNNIESPEIIKQIRGGGMVRYFKIYRLKECKKLIDK